MTAENPHAGQGAVLIDIGDDIGALIVRMPDALLDVDDEIEVEIVPTGTAHAHSHPHSHDDTHAHEHPHEHDHAHEHGHAHPPHVAVVARPLPDGTVVASLVFGSIPEGTYDLYIRPDGPVQLTATVTGGEVTEAVWPGA